MSIAATIPAEGFNTDDIVVLKQQRLALLSKKLELIKRDALPFYKPHPKQDSFHRSTARRRGAFTSNRFGKSHMGIAEDCAWLRHERSWYAKGDPARTSGLPSGPVKGLVIVNDWDKAKEIFTGDDGKLWKFLPKDGFIKRTSHNHSGAIDTIHCHNGCSLRFDTVKSFMSNPLGSESSDWDFIHVDEPCPEQMFKASARGLIDRQGSAWFLLTALKEPWITDAFEPGGMFYVKGQPNPFVIEGSIYDNTFLSLSAIGEYAATLTDDEKECRLYGKPLHKAGLVYKEFQRDVHVLSALPRGWRSWTEPPVDWSYYAYIDPHAHNPLMGLFVVVDPFGTKYFYHDIFEKALIRDFCEHIHTTFGNVWKNGQFIKQTRKLIRVRIDPIAYIEDPENGTTWADEFWRCGLPVQKASKDLSRGIMRVKEELKASIPLKGTDIQPKPRIWFTPECRRLLWEIGRYHWDEQTGKPVDKDDHAVECLYRAILDEPRYVDPTNQNVVVTDVQIPRTPELRSEEGVNFKDLDDIKSTVNDKDLDLAYL